MDYFMEEIQIIQLIENLPENLPENLVLRTKG
jgi:hypothetical protein